MQLSLHLRMFSIVRRLILVMCSIRLAQVIQLSRLSHSDLQVDYPPKDAVMLANYASGIVVRHVGNYAPSPTELSDAIQHGLNNLNSG